MSDQAADLAVPEDLAPVVEEEIVEPEAELSPYDKDGDWFVIQSYSGYENKVSTNLGTRTRSMHLEDRIFECVIPMEMVVEIKKGKKVEVERKQLPGYVLVRMWLDDDTWYAVRNTPGVTGFVGPAVKPVPLTRREVERFLGGAKKEDKKVAKFKPAWELGDSVRVITGPFADFNGNIESINIEQSKVVVLVNIFGRDTPVELDFSDIHKN
jgi:transcriptional antiterminator NusG